MSGWVQIVKAFECQANEFALYHVGNGETLKTPHAWGGMMKRGNVRKCIWMKGEMEEGRPEGWPRVSSLPRDHSGRDCRSGREDTERGKVI